MMVVQYRFGRTSVKRQTAEVGKHLFVLRVVFRHQNVNAPVAGNTSLLVRAKRAFVWASCTSVHGQGGVFLLRLPGSTQR